VAVGGGALAPQLAPSVSRPADDPSKRHRPMRSHLRALEPNVEPAPVPAPAEPAQPRRLRLPALPNVPTRALIRAAAILLLVAGVAFVASSKLGSHTPAKNVTSEVPAGGAPGVPVIRYVFTIGDTRSYAMALSVSGAKPLSIAATLTWKVIGTVEDGSAVIVLDTAGDNVPAEMRHARFIVGPDGHVQSLDGSAGPFASLAADVDQAALQAMFARLPGKATAAGETWSDDKAMRMPGTTGALEIRTTDTDNGVSNGFARIAQLVDVPFELPNLSGTLHMASNFRLVPSTGEIAGLTANVSQDVAGAQQTKISISLDRLTQ
jgi:hypothetical protein